ncbi:MAG: RNA 3'-terminal phosphate cyclase [Candidatus Bipolaricaulia bacterium]
MIEIDGSRGGGSVVRIAVGLAAVIGVPVRIIHIRRTRPKSGLQHQHLAGIKAVVELCADRVVGMEFGSETVEFYPGEIRRKTISIKIPTAGAIGLALQPIQLACLKATTPVAVRINGGATFGKWAPPAPYLTYVKFRILKRFGHRSKLHVDRDGFYPKGGARVIARFYPPEAKHRVDLEERGKLLRIRGRSLASTHLKNAKVAERQARATRQTLVDRFSNLQVGVRAEYRDTASPGSGIVLWAEHERTVIGASALGERGKPSEIVGQEAAEDLIEELVSGATLDRHMCDQILPYIAIFGGAFHYREMTDHMRANIEVIETILGKQFEVDEHTIRS